MNAITFQQILFIRQARAAMDAVQEARLYTREPAVLRKLNAACDLVAEAFMVFQHAATEVALEKLRRKEDEAGPVAMEAPRQLAPAAQ